MDHVYSHITVSTPQPIVLYLTHFTHTHTHTQIIFIGFLNFTKECQVYESCFSQVLGLNSHKVYLNKNTVRKPNSDSMLLPFC